MTARILDILPDEYHTRPGLSASIATTLITRSPLHAHAEHPCFGGKGKTPTREMDFGTVGHALVLGKGKQFESLDFDDWKTRAAQAARKHARDAGKVPILAHHLTRAEACAEAVVRQLGERGIALNGQSELAIEWEEASRLGPVLCRAMFDHVWLTAGVILDLKIVGNAEISQLERSAERFGYGIQSAAYKSALADLDSRHAGRVRFLFAFVESDEPYAMNLTEPDGMLRELGERRWRRAVETWATCIKTNEWPGYGRSVNKLSAPAWALAREEI